MPLTSNKVFYPAASAQPNVPADMQTMAQSVDDNFLPRFTPGRIHAYKTNDQDAGSNATVPFTLLLNGTVGAAQNISLNTSTGVMTIGAGAGGEYNCFGAANIKVGGAARVFATVYVNGAEVLRGQDNINRGALANDVVGSILSGQITLAAGDQVTLRYLHTGPTGTGIVAPNGTFVNWLQLRRIS